MAHPGTAQGGRRVTVWSMLAGYAVTVYTLPPEYKLELCVAKPASWAAPAAAPAAQVTSSLARGTRMLQQKTRSWAQSGQSELHIHAAQLRTKPNTTPVCCAAGAQVAD
jgi:hypothetical protein